MKKLFLFAWLMMLSIVAVAQNEEVGNDLVIKNETGTVVDLIFATENTEMKFNVQDNKLTIKQDDETKDISLDEVKTITTFPAFKLVAQKKFVNTSTLPITLHFKLTGNDHGEMKPVSGESVRFTAGKGKLASTTATTNDDGVATVEYTPEQSLWAPGFSDVIKALYTFTDSQGRVSRYTAKAIVEYNGDYTIECLTPDQNLGPDEEAEAVFAVYEVSPSGKKPCAGASIEFSAPEGYITTQSTVTDADGMARVTFHNQGDDAKEYLVRARYGIWMNGAYYTGTAAAKFTTLNYKLEAATPKKAVRDDGSDQDCFFSLFEYHNGEWILSQKEVEAKFEATGVTLTQTSDLNRGYGFIANFTVGKSFNQGSVTAKCDIPLKDGKVWQGVATTELVLDDYLFTKISPDGNPVYVYPEESEDVVFLLTKLVNGKYQFCPGMEVKFECLEGGTLSNTQVKTDADGLATTSFLLNKDGENATVSASCSFADEQGVWHDYSEIVEFELIPYRLEPVRKKVAVQNDGSEHSCDFKLYEYDYESHKWEECKEEVIVNFEATGVTLTNTSDKNDGHGVTANFTAGKSFQEGSVTAKCDRDLENGKVWHGVATVELVPDDYLFSRVIPTVSISEITETKEVEFTLTKRVNGQYQGCQGHEVSFECDRGTSSRPSVVTDAKGMAFTLFTIDKEASIANIIARCSFIDENDVYHEYKEKVDFFIPPYLLTCLTSEVEMKKSDGKAPIRFKLLQYKEGEWVACPDVKLTFTASNGSASPDYAITNKDGICQTEFFPSKDATEGTVTGMTKEFVIQFDDVKYIIWSDRKTAHITITDGGGGDGPGGGGGPGGGDVKDEDLKKADKLKDDTYVIDDKVVSLDGADDEVIETVIENNLGEKTTLFDWFKEDPVYYTIAWGGIYGFTDDMLGKEIDYLKEKANGNENLRLSFGAFIDPAGGYSETNVIEFNQENLEKAVFKMTRNSDGTLSVIAYCKRKDGKVGMFKAKTKKSN